jgi:hypothetical protein
MRSVSLSMHALPRTSSKGTSRSSHVAMVPSLLSSSFSQARSCFNSSIATAETTTTLEGEEGLQPLTSGNQHHDKKQAQVAASTEQNPTRLTMKPSQGKRPSLPARRWLTAIKAGPLALMTLVMVSATSHHEKWSKASFKIRAKEGHLLYPNSLVVEIAR